MDSYVNPIKEMLPASKLVEDRVLSICVKRSIPFIIRQLHHFFRADVTWPWHFHAWRIDSIASNQAQNLYKCPDDIFRLMQIL